MHRGKLCRGNLQVNMAQLNFIFGEIKTIKNIDSGAIESF
jgi:hypothetical protein